MSERGSLLLKQALLAVKRKDVAEVRYRVIEYRGLPEKGYVENE